MTKVVVSIMALFAFVGGFILGDQIELKYCKSYYQKGLN